MYKVGLSSTSKPLTDDMFRKYSEAGLYAMEISVPRDKLSDINYKELSELSKRHNVKLWSFHLPFKPFDEIDLARTDLCKYTVSYMSELIKKAADIGIDKFVTHSSGVGLTEENRAERMECAKESLAALAEVASQNGAVIAVENLPPICLGKNSDEISQLISADDRLRVCFDTNHLLGEDPMDFLDKHGSKLVTMHVSDYDLIFERHWLPGEGKLDWQKIYNKLKEINYNGVWLYEIAFHPLATIIRDRDLTCEDFVRNANEIFENKELTVIGRPADNL